MPEILTYTFMQRAFIAGAVIALICSSTGIFLVLRRLSMIGDTLSHVALAGVAGGMAGGVYPVYSAVVFALLAAFAIEKLRNVYIQFAELSIAIMLSIGIGLATILISLGRSNAAIFGYLFGSITLVNPKDLYTITILGIFIIFSIAFFHKALFNISFDEESARLAGVPVKWVNLYFMILVAVTVALSMRIVGILLVSSLMIVPVAAGLQAGRSFKGTWAYSLLFSILSVLIGLIISFYGNLAPGGAIVLSAVGILVIVLLVKKCFKGAGRLNFARRN